MLRCVVIHLKNLKVSFFCLCCAANITSNFVGKMAPKSRYSGAIRISPYFNVGFPNEIHRPSDHKTLLVLWFLYGFHIGCQAIHLSDLLIYGKYLTKHTIILTNHVFVIIILPIHHFISTIDSFLDGWFTTGIVKKSCLTETPQV